MKILLDLRLNILNSIVDKFVIVESKIDHAGNHKKLNFNINNFTKFKDKIEYFVLEELPVKKKIFSKSWRNSPNWIRENYQRNCLLKGFKDSDDNDLIMISDIDEIPNPKMINKFEKKNKYACFVQKNFQSKINLLNTSEPNWYGTRICVKKFIKSPMWLKNIKIKKKNFWKFFQPKPPQLILEGGWHFSFLKTSEGISKKIMSYAHQEYNNSNKNNIDLIQKRVDEKRDILDRDFVYKKINLDSTFPDFIIKNKDKLKAWIL